MDLKEHLEKLMTITEKKDTFCFVGKHSDKVITLEDARGRVLEFDVARMERILSTVLNWYNPQGVQEFIDAVLALEPKTATIYISIPQNNDEDLIDRFISIEKRSFGWQQYK